MLLNPLFIQTTLPTTSQAAIREFNERYLAAIGAAQPTGWADTLGELVPTDSPMTTFPISQLRTLYRRTTGEQQMKKLREASFDVKTEEFDDGYQATLMDLYLKVFAYRQWQLAPSRLVLAEEQHRHTQIARLVDGNGTRSGTASGNQENYQGGTNIKCVDGQNFFSTAHPANMVDPTVSGTWSNYDSTGLDIYDGGAIDTIQSQVELMQTNPLDENGNLLGVNPDTILVPMDKYEKVNNLLAKSLLLSTGSGSADVSVAATDNFYKNRFTVVPVKEFTMVSGSSADWYLLDSKLIKSGAPPWLSMRQTVPGSLSFRQFDESSDFFKNTGDIKMSSHIWYGFSLVLPHGIRKIKGDTR